MVHYPSQSSEWTLDQKFAGIKKAGFDGVIHPPAAGLSELTEKHGLELFGYAAFSKASDFPTLLQANKDCGARYVNVHLGKDGMSTPEAVGLAILLMQEGRKLGLELAIEAHRDTCTETPEKTYALADFYQKITGEILPITWDFSHFAVVKHLVPSNFIEKLIVRPDLIQRSQQFHFRPFNGQHSQVPVTDGAGNLTQEMSVWLPFAEAVLRCWLDGSRNTECEIFICPEMGPVVDGYNLSSLPNSWEEAQRLRSEIDKLWRKLTNEDKA